MTQTEAEMIVCMQCGQELNAEDDRETTDEGVLCCNCYDSLAAQVKSLIEQQGQGINYPLAIIGAALGGIVGAAIWWGFTVMTGWEFGLVAVVIGFTVAKGILLFTGGKRSIELQILAVVVSALSYFYANYLVSRTWVLKEYPEYGGNIGLIPDISIFIEMTRLTFGMFTAIFLAIVVWQAWQLVAPAKID
ncbi:MAG: hypothetical protein PVJ84_11185 [Desulfobacteraceae bacterium]